MSRPLFVAITVLLICAPQGLGWRRRRGYCPVTSCEVSQWTPWSTCSQDCGNGGEQSRTRTKTVKETCGGGCSYQLTEHRSCNRFCMNGGTPSHSYCHCRQGFTGTCCDISKNSGKQDSGHEGKNSGNQDSGQKGSSSGEVAGIVVGSVLGVAIVIVCIVRCLFLFCN